MIVACRVTAICAVSAVGLACNDPPTAPLPADLVVVQAPSSVGAPGWELIDTLKVRAVDPDGSPRSGVTVLWGVRQGGGSVAPAVDTTDADGIARAVWTLGGRPGANAVRASTLTGAFTDFNASGEAFRVDRLVSAWGIGCGLVDGAIWCWGDFFWGRGSPVSHNADFGWGDYGPELVDGTHQFVDLSVNGKPSVCGLDNQGAVWCASGDAPLMAVVAGLPAIHRLVSSTGKQCGLARSDSTPWCWGPGGAGAQVPGMPSLLGLWMDKFSADSTGCGLRADSTAICWGSGPLGDGSSANSATPVVVAGGHRFAELAVAIGFACGRTAGLEVWCWGQDTPDNLLVPTLTIVGAHGIGTELPDVQVVTALGGLTRWEGAAFGPILEPTGVAGLPVIRMATNNNLDCIQLVDDQVYCFDEMFENSSALGTRNYSPVQPIRPAALSAMRGAPRGRGTE